MSILVFYGSYRSDRLGIRLAHFIIEGFRARGDEVELVDAKAIDLPMLDRMYKEYPKGHAPERLEQLAAQCVRGLLFPSRTARGWSGGRRQGCCVRHPLEAGGEPTSPGKVNRARPRLGAAPPSAPPATRPSAGPGPRSSQLSLCPLKDRF